MVDKIRKKLSSGKSKNMSMDGRLVLLKSFLSLISVYFISFFLASTNIVSSIESLFKSFLWGGVRRHVRFIEIRCA
jgi:hypothetical protein